MSRISRSRERAPDRAGFAGTGLLGDFRLAATSDPDEAQSVLSRELVDVRVRRVQDASSFRLEMNGVHLGRTLVGSNHFGTDTIIEAGEVSAPAILFVSHCRGAATTIEIDQTPVTCTRRGAVISPSRRVVNHRPAGGHVFGMRAELQALEAQCGDLPRSLRREPLVFEPDVDLESSAGRHARAVLSFVLDTVERNAGVLECSATRASLDDLVLGALLALPNSFSAALAEQEQRPVAPGLVRRAEDFLADRAREPVTVGDVVAEIGCSRRTLFGAFRRHRGCTPMEFLVEVRLRLAREALLSPAPGATVSSIALECGFPHLGRFAAIYRKHFGEPPSQTLRRA